jgi:hypothetical protein
MVIFHYFPISFLSTVRPLKDGPVLRSLVMQTLGEASAWPEALQLLLGNPKQHRSEAMAG